jgi:hypothetical protein
LSGICGPNPKSVFNIFREHINDVLHRTVTEVSLNQIETKDHKALLQFARNVSVPIGSGYYFYLGQSLRAVKTGSKEYCLRTIGYSYRIADGPDRKDWLIRWEYNSRETEQQAKALHPRHHCHLQAKMPCFNNKDQLSLAKMHISSGWVTFEEVIRFAIQELKVVPRFPDKWDQLLKDSEKKFKLWTKIKN